MSTRAKVSCDTVERDILLLLLHEDSTSDLVRFHLDMTKITKSIQLRDLEPFLNEGQQKNPLYRWCPMANLYLYLSRSLMQLKF